MLGVYGLSIWAGLKRFLGDNEGGGGDDDLDHSILDHNDDPLQDEEGNNILDEGAP